MKISVEIKDKFKQLVKIYQDIKLMNVLIQL